MKRNRRPATDTQYQSDNSLILSKQLWGGFVSGLYFSIDTDLIAT